MSDLAAGLLTIGLILGFGLPGLYWIFFKMDSNPGKSEKTDSFPKPISDVGI